VRCADDENLRNYCRPVILMFRPCMETRRLSPRTLIMPVGRGVDQGFLQPLHEVTRIPPATSRSDLICIIKSAIIHVRDLLFGTGWQKGNIFGAQFPNALKSSGILICTQVIISAEQLFGARGLVCPRRYSSRFTAAAETQVIISAAAEQLFGSPCFAAGLE
jgi:hypothetical protein